ncbi:MAG: SDR family oxidoreductase [Niabella sp.]
MRVLVTGTNGFIGGYVVKCLLDAGIQVLASSRGKDELPFAGMPGYTHISAELTDGFDIHDLFDRAKPDVVVHCAAMSKPDECEQNQALAYGVNVGATVQLLLHAADYKSHFIHLSTDFIFDGEEAGMYTEEAAPNPVNYYGSTKLEAEEAVREYEHDWAIVRTVFVYGKPLGKRGSFITLIADKLHNQHPFRVVNDQLRTPVHVTDLAKGILSIIGKRAKGVYNLGGPELLTPYEMAMQIAAHLGCEQHQLTPVTCQDFIEPAKRPLKTGLDISKAARDLGYQPMPFKEGLIRSL